MLAHLRALAFAPLGLALLACGARPSLDVDAAVTSTTTSAGGGTSATATGAGGSTSTTGAGGTGAGGAACSTLTWAGEPVFMPAAYTPRNVRLLRTGIAEHAVVFDMIVPDATLLESAALPAWWTSWPPQMGLLGTSDGLSWQYGGHVVSPGEPGPGFAFAALVGAQMRLGLAKPGEMSNTLVTWSGPSGEVKTLARNNGGAYLAGYGPESGLAIDVLPAFVMIPQPVTMGALGCSSMPLAADATGLGDDAFLVASTNDTPFDNCFDPVLPGPPLVVQILHVSTTGNVQQGGFIEESGPVLDLQLTGRIGGAWLAYRADGDPTLHIRRVDEKGQLGEDFSVFGNPRYGDALAALGDGFAHAFVYPGETNNQTAPFVSLYVRGGAEVVQIDKPFATPVHPRRRPAVAVSDDGRSILIAFIEDAMDGSPPAIGLLRADCAP